MRGNTPDSIKLNHARLVNLLSCRRDGEGIYESTTVRLALDPSDVQFVPQNFPQLCLYGEYRFFGGELESLVRFLLQPLPPAGYSSRGVGCR